MEVPPPKDEFATPAEEDFGPPDEGFETGSAPAAGPSATRRRVRIAITLVLVAALIALAAVEGSGVIIRTEPVVLPTPNAPATSAPGAARIAVVDAEGALSSMEASGGSVISYPAPGVTLQFPTWSPDGTRIAAIATDPAGVSGGVDVFAAAAAAGGSAGSGTLGTPGVSVSAPAAEPTTVYSSPDHPAFYAYWAPDGGSLAFLTNEPTGIALRRAAADASAPATTVRIGAPMYWQWVDPTRLLVHSGGDLPEGFVGEVGLTGAPATGAASTGGPFRAPGLSGTGTYIAYATSGAGEAATVVVAARDGSMRHDVRVIGGAAFEFGPVGDTLAFVAADKAGTAAQLPVGPLRIVNPVTGTVRTLLGGSVVTFFWSPDGRTIAALRLNGPGDTNVALQLDGLASLARAGAPPEHPAAAEQPATAPGLQLLIAFVDVATGAVRSERVGRLSDLFVNQVVPYYDQYALSHRFWSPDSASLLLPLDDDQGVSQLTVIPADGSDSRVVTAGAIGTWSP